MVATDGRRGGGDDVTDPQWLIDARNEGRILSETPARVDSSGQAKLDNCDVTPPPSVNNLFVNVRGRGRVKSKAYRDWIAANAWKVQRLEPITAPRFGVSLWVYGGEGLNMGRDIDNMAKPVLDLLVATKRIPGDSLRAGLHLVSVGYFPSNEGEAFVRIQLTILCEERS